MLKRPAASTLKDSKLPNDKHNTPVAPCKGKTSAQQKSSPIPSSTGQTFAQHKSSPNGFCTPNVKDNRNGVELQLRAALAEAQSAKFAAEARANSSAAAKAEAEKLAAAAEARIKNTQASNDEAKKRVKTAEDRLVAAEQSKARAEGMADVWKRQAENSAIVEQTCKVVLERAANAEGQVETFRKFQESMPDLVRSIVCPLLQNMHSPDVAVKREVGDMSRSHRRKRWKPSCLPLEDGQPLIIDDNLQPAPKECPEPLNSTNEVIPYVRNKQNNGATNHISTTKTWDQPPVTSAQANSSSGTSDAARDLLLNFYKVGR